MSTGVPFYLVYCLIARVLKAKVYHGVLKGPAHVELQRQVVDSLQMAREDMSKVINMLQSKCV